MKKVYIVAVILVVIGIVAIFTQKGTTQNIGSESTATIQKVEDAPTLSLQKQLVVNSIDIDLVNMVQPGYIVIREVLKGKLAQISEVSELLATGLTENLTIELPEIPRDEISLVAVLYEDDGDGGFNPLLDTRVKKDGKVVAVSIDTGIQVLGDLFGSADENAQQKEATVTIAYIDSGYSPVLVIIEKGETVSFINNSSRPMWVASDPHPAHTILSSFDQFAISEPGSVYQYTFDEVGTWNYHDHVNPSFVGSVVVTEPVIENTTLPTLEKNKTGYYEASPDDFAELTENPDVTTINVHIPYAGEIEGTEGFAAYNDTQKLIAALPDDKDAPIALYCLGGGMSKTASKDLVAAGYTNVYDLTGGMNAYTRSGGEVLQNI